MSTEIDAEVERILRKMKSILKKKYTTIEKEKQRQENVKYVEKNVGRGLSLALKLTYKAYDEERKGNYKEAVRLFEESEGYFLYAIKHEAKTEEEKKAAEKKRMEFVEKAKKLRSSVEREEISTRIREMALNIK